MHAVAFSKNIPWLAQTSVITLETQTHAVNTPLKGPLTLQAYKTKSHLTILPDLFVSA